MQQRINNKTAKVKQKHDSQSNVQIQKQAEESSNAQTHDFHPLENITCKIGDSACAAKHVSVIQRSGLFHPMNENQKVQSLLKLQQQYGNRFVQRVIVQHAIQAKLKVGQPGDIYEQEADRVAEQVMQMSDSQIQRQPEEEEEEELQTKPLAEQITPLVQRQIEEEELQTKAFPNQASEFNPNVEARINAIRSGGQALPEFVRAFFEPRFGYDFSQVQVHTDAEADTLSSSLDARAFTTGQDIFAYNPSDSSGRELLAHELTHVAQQNGDKVQRKLTIGQPGDRYEQETDHVVQLVMQREQQAAPKEVDERLVQRQPEEEEETIQAKSEDARVQRQDLDILSEDPDVPDGPYIDQVDRKIDTPMVQRQGGGAARPTELIQILTSWTPGPNRYGFQLKFRCRSTSGRVRGIQNQAPNLIWRERVTYSTNDFAHRISPPSPTILPPGGVSFAAANTRRVGTNLLEFNNVTDTHWMPTAAVRAADFVPLGARLLPAVS